MMMMYLIFNYYYAIIKPKYWIVQISEKVFLVSEYYPKGRLDAFLKDCVNTYDGKTFTNLLDIGQDRIMVSSTR